MFTRADFELYQPRFQADAEWNGRRLDVRRRLQALGERVRAAYAERGIALDRRESIHHPHAVNQKRVARQRTMLFRDRKARAALQRFLGRELGRDLDSAQNNVHLQAGLDAAGFFWGLRLDAGAWYDLNALVKRAEEEDGRAEILRACAAAPGFQLLVDGGGARLLERMTSRDWRDLAGILRPGQSTLDVVQRLAPAAVAGAGDFEEGVVADLARLAALMRLATWTLEAPGGRVF